MPLQIGFGPEVGVTVPFPYVYIRITVLSRPMKYMAMAPEALGHVLKSRHLLYLSFACLLSDDT